MTKRTRKRRSKFEHSVQSLLDKRKDLVAKYEPRQMPYVLDLEYTPDWECIPYGPSTKRIYLEAKGKFDYIERRKILAVIRCNPDDEIRMVFMRDNRISKKSSTTYTQWCEKHGIKASVFPKLPFGGKYDD